MKRTRLFMLMLLLAAPAASAQDTSIETADAAFAAGNWSQAASLYGRVVALDPDNGRAWYRLADASYRNGSLDNAVTGWTTADSLGFAPAPSRYNIAAVRAVQGRPDDAFRWLGLAVEAGFARIDAFLTDPDFDALRADARMDAVRTGINRNRYPCRYDERYRAFDFWIGTWDVTAGGNPAGTNRIEPILGGCVLMENWESAGGGSGKSFNYFDPASGGWRQNWTDAQGGHIRFTGGPQDGGMHFEGTNVYPDGRETMMQMTFTPLEDGHVRQFIRESTDGGATWGVWFDGHYARRD